MLNLGVLKFNHMALYHYHISNKQIASMSGEVTTIPKDFKSYKRTFSEGDIYYKVSNRHISEVICDIENGEQKSRQKVKEFLDNLLMD